ncbi:MAG: RNA polymerase sigma-70 factor (ECF subfamily) [Limisphaerales bacterium]|jgi:RNA polymerase sigma-70 factor (ECF subfamily)
MPEADSANSFPVTTLSRAASLPVKDVATGSVASDNDDTELLRNCQRGDERALEQLVARYQQRIYGLALHVAGDTSLAEEAAVDSFYKIWCKAGQWRGDTSAESWIYRIAVRTVLDLKRGRLRWWRRSELVEKDESTEANPGPSAALVADENRQATAAMLETAMRTLNTDDRALVHLYYFEERGLKEIAAILETPSANLKMRLARARQKLRRVLETEEDNETRR